MKFSPIVLASIAAVYAGETREQVAQVQAQTQQAMSGYEGAMTNARQVQDTLNERLRADGGIHANEERILAYVTGMDSQIDNVVATVSNALAPFTGGLSKAIGNFLLGPYVQAASNGAEVFLSNVIGNAEDRLDAEMIGRMTGDYSRLIALSKENNVDTKHLEDINARLVNTLPKAKRATAADLAGAHGSMVNHQQVMDTLNARLNQAGGDPHEHADRMLAFITGADSQIDNAIATMSAALAPYTGGLSQAIGNFLLGPYLQAASNGAEVLLSNLVGGAFDRMDAERVARLTGNYSRLAALSVKNNLDPSKLQDLNKKIQNTLPKLH